MTIISWAGPMCSAFPHLIRKGMIMPCSGEWCPSQRYVHNLIPAAGTSGLIWGKGLCGCNQAKDLRWNHSRLPGWALKPMTSVFIKDRRREVTERSQGQCEDGSEVGVMQRLAKGCLQPPGMGKGRTDSLLDSSEGARTHLVPDVGFPSYEKNKCPLLQATQFVDICYGSPRRLMHPYFKGEKPEAQRR